MTAVCWNGCSFTFGAGFAEDQRNQYIYDRLISKQFDFDSTNIAVSGSSNLEIFKRSAQAILDNKYNIVVTQWSALNRIWLYPGPDCSFFLNDTRYPDFKYRDIYIDCSTKTKLKETLLLLNHDYHNILDLISYCCILECMAFATNTRVIFVNGLVPWEDDLVRDFSNIDIGCQLSAYTKSILDFDNRDDHEITILFQQLQNNFKKLNQSLWVNMFDSMQSNACDAGPEGHHPGILSHQSMADQISKYLTRNQIQ
jgi:hypothetical protein